MTSLDDHLASTLPRPRRWRWPWSKAITEQTGVDVDTLAPPVHEPCGTPARRWEHGEHSGRWRCDPCAQWVERRDAHAPSCPRCKSATHVRWNGTAWVCLAPRRVRGSWRDTPVRVPCGTHVRNRVTDAPVPCPLCKHPQEWRGGEIGWHCVPCSVGAASSRYAPLVADGALHVGSALFRGSPEAATLTEQEWTQRRAVAEADERRWAGGR